MYVYEDDIFYVYVHQDGKIIKDGKVLDHPNFI